MSQRKPRFPLPSQGAGGHRGLFSRHPPDDRGHPQPEGPGAGRHAASSRRTDATRRRRGPRPALPRVREWWLPLRARRPRRGDLSFGDDGLKVTSGRSKTDQEGLERMVGGLFGLVRRPGACKRCPPGSVVLYLTALAVAENKVATALGGLDRCSTSRGNPLAPPAHGPPPTGSLFDFSKTDRRRAGSGGRERRTRMHALAVTGAFRARQAAARCRRGVAYRLVPAVDLW